MKAVILVVVLLVLSQSKPFETFIKFTDFKEHDGWLPVISYVAEPDQVRFHITARVFGKAKGKSHDLYMQWIPESKWLNETIKKCKSSVTMPVSIHGIKMTGQKTFNILRFGMNETERYYLVFKDCYTLFRKEYNNEDLSLYIKIEGFWGEKDYGAPEIDAEPVGPLPVPPPEDDKIDTSETSAEDTAETTEELKD